MEPEKSGFIERRKHPSKGGILPGIVVLVVMWFVLAGFVLSMSSPWHPRTKLGWALFVAIAPPLYLLGELGGEWLFSTEHGRRISAKRLSGLRIVFALAVMLAWFLFSRLLSKWLGIT